MKQNLFLAALGTMVLPACNGTFGGLYDDVADPQSDQRAVNVGHGTLTVDATSYVDWQYVDLSAEMLDVRTIGTDDSEPSDWTFALHRYDVKTNGCSAAATNYKSINELLNDPSFAVEDYSFEPDTVGSVTTDMSHMMEGYLVYSPSHINGVVCSWLNVDTSTMPPIYTMNGNVFLLRTAGGALYALRLVNFMNDASIKGHMTIEYHKLEMEEP